MVTPWKQCFFVVPRLFVCASTPESRLTRAEHAPEHLDSRARMSTESCTLIWFLKVQITHAKL
jgi:hypothetical protein